VGVRRMKSAPLMCSRLAVLLAAAAMLACGHAFAQSQVVSVTIAGTLNNRHVEQLRAAAERIRGDPQPTGLIIILDSLGGDGRAAMAMGRMAREKNAHIFVKGTCRSACVFLLAGGVYRDARAFSIGIHRGRITRTVAGKGTFNADIENDPRAREVLELAEREAQDYLEQMGMPRLFEAMQKVPNSQIKLLPLAEATTLGLLGHDAGYLERRAPIIQSRYGVDTGQWVERAAKVREQCEAELEQPSKFLACYRPLMLKE